MRHAFRGECDASFIASDKRARIKEICAIKTRERAECVCVCGKFDVAIDSREIAGQRFSMENEYLT